MPALTEIYNNIVETGHVPPDLKLRREEKITLEYALKFYKFGHLAAKVKQCKIVGGFDEDDFATLNDAYETAATMLEKFADDKNISQEDKIAFFRKLTSDISVINSVPSS